MTIAEVSKKYDLTADTLRYYEKIGLLNNVPRTESGIRNYDKNSCRMIEFIKCMRGAGLSIEVLARYIKLFYLGDSTHEERKNILIEERKKLIEKRDAIQTTIDKLDYKISSYDKIMSKKEKELLR